MKIAVLVKSVPDTASTPAFREDGKSVDLDGLEMVLNPYDEYAVEEGIRIRESLGGEVVAVALGGAEARKGIRSALAMGADRGVLINPPAGVLTARGVARMLSAAVSSLRPDLVLAGKQAVDSDGAQVPERVAEILGFSHASAVSRCRAEGDRVVVDCEIEGEHWVLELPLPALLTTEKGINTPRYPALPAVLKARSKEIREIAPAELGIPEDVGAAPQVVIEALTLPRHERRRIILGGDTSTACRPLISFLHGENLAV